MNPTFSLEDRVAIVTGASRGIGAAVARSFVRAGAKVVLASRKLESLQQLAEELGPSAHPFAVHTGKEADCIALMREAVRRFGKADVLVNNAGTNPYFGPLLEVENAAWDKTFEVNLKGYFWTARELEIGRASCRERVEMSVGAGSIKKREVGGGDTDERV